MYIFLLDPKAIPELPYLIVCDWHRNCGIIYGGGGASYGWRCDGNVPYHCLSGNNSYAGDQEGNGRWECR